MLRQAALGRSGRGFEYVLFGRKGPVASSLFETGGFWYADPDARSPDIQFHLGLGTGHRGTGSWQNCRRPAITLNSCLPAPALARHGPAVLLRSGCGAAD
jgi:choline dehydrogenase-like flavoprotein